MVGPRMGVRLWLAFLWFWIFPLVVVIKFLRRFIVLITKERTVLFGARFCNMYFGQIYKVILSNGLYF